MLRVPRCTTIVINEGQRHHRFPQNDWRQRRSDPFVFPTTNPTAPFFHPIYPPHIPQALTR